MNHNGPMSSRLWAFVIWAAVAATAVYWGLRLFARGQAAPAHAVAVGLSGGAPAAGGDLTRLLGAAPVAAAPAAAAEPAGDARFKLVGVVAPRRNGAPDGLALISVDGKPAKPVGLGGVVDGSLVLLTVSHRRAELGPRGGAAQVTLELPAVPEAARGTLPPPGSPVAAGVPVPPLPGNLPAASPSLGVAAPVVTAPGAAPVAAGGDPAAAPAAVPPTVMPPAVPQPLPPGLRQRGMPGAGGGTGASS